MYVLDELPTVTVADVLTSVAVRVADDTGNPVNLTDVDVAATYTAPDGVTADLGATVTGGTVVTVDLSGASLFTVEGIAYLSLILNSTSGDAVQVEPAPWVVESDVPGWWTIATARAAWRDAPRSDERLWSLLNMARLQVVAWAPASVDATAAVPANYREAQLAQARNLWNATRTDPSQQGIGDDGLIIRPYPLDWTVKAMIRPKSPVPVVR